MGYIGFSISAKAAKAKQDGRYPKTEFKQVYGISEKKFQELLKGGVIYKSEWHHTSCKYNRTDFFDIDDKVKFFIAIGDKQSAYEEYKAEKAKRLAYANKVATTKKIWKSSIMLKKQDDRANELLSIGMRYDLTKRGNYNFYLDKEMLKYAIVRELFS